MKNKRAKVSLILFILAFSVAFIPFITDNHSDLILIEEGEDYKKYNIKGTDRYKIFITPAYATTWSSNNPTSDGYSHATGAGSICPATSDEAVDNSQNLIVTIAASGVADGCYRSYVEFNTTAIPDTSYIETVNFYFDVVSLQNLPDGDHDYTDFMSMMESGARPSLLSNNSLWIELGDGDFYIYENISSLTTFNLDLGATAADDLDTLLPSNWFAVGMKLRNETRDPAIGIGYQFGAEEHPTSIKPTLEVVYGPSPPTSWEESTIPLCNNSTATSSSGISDNNFTAIPHTKFCLASVPSDGRILSVNAQLGQNYTGTVYLGLYATSQITLGDAIDLSNPLYLVYYKTFFNPSKQLLTMNMNYEVKAGQTLAVAISASRAGLWINNTSTSNPLYNVTGIVPSQITAYSLHNISDTSRIFALMRYQTSSPDVPPIPSPEGDLADYITMMIDLTGLGDFAGGLLIGFIMLALLTGALSYVRVPIFGVMIILTCAVAFLTAIGIFPSWIIVLIFIAASAVMARSKILNP